MKKFIIAIAAICMLTISAYADNECDSKYNNMLKRLQSLTETEMSEELKTGGFRNSKKHTSFARMARKSKQLKYWES